MDLRTSDGRAVAIGMAWWALVLGGCSDTPFEYSDEALRLPATLGDALPLATSLARAESGNAFLTRMGGGFTVMDDRGRASNHSFLFHAREGLSKIRITVHLIHGSPWVKRETVPDIPGPFEEGMLTLDSDGVVERAIQSAPSHGVTVTSAFAARLSTVPSWPEPADATGVGDAVAWRVDFLTLQTLNSGVAVYFSAARFYFDPRTGEELGVVIPPNPELYPFP